MALPSRVTIVEVGPRDGLQNEAGVVPTATKIAFVDQLSRRRARGDRGLGVRVAEVGAADGRRQRGVRRHHPARRRPLHGAGAEPGRPRPRRGGRASPRSRSSPPRRETFSKKNINQTIDESLATYRAVCDAALGTGACASAGISPPASDARSRAPCLRRRSPTSPDGCSTSASSRSPSATRSASRTPGRSREVLDPVTARVPLAQVALHLHDTRGTALANVLAGLQYGVTTFDSAAGGLGGCPYAPGASGNLATEDLLYMLDGMGICDRRVALRAWSRRHGRWLAPSAIACHRSTCRRQADGWR